MNKRLLKKIAKKNTVTKEDARVAWNVVARYLNTRPELSFHLDPWNKETRENKYSINIYNESTRSFEDILTADTIWDK